MDMTQMAVEHGLSPATTRVAAQRLLAWLPVGPAAMLGDSAPGLLAALRSHGMSIQTGATGADAAAGIIVLTWSDVLDDAVARLQTLLADFSGPVCLVVSGAAAQAGDRAFWEAAVIQAEWRKHPLNERVAPYGELDRVSGLVMLAFERVPSAAVAVYPLQALVEERDLHTDMTREPGRRSDAHMTRYAQAAQFIRPGDRVIDVACGLGYGSYQLAHDSQAGSFTGVDASEFAVEYATVNFAAVSPTPMRFAVGDAQDLTGMADESADFAVSVETLEHLPEPDRLLAELHRVLSPAGRVYASVPNDWSDETGEDPNPFHFHVYDWERLVAQFTRNGFEIEKAWLQDAGGGQKRSLSARSMLEIDPVAGPACDGEWLLVLARKRTAAVAVDDDPLASVRALLLDGRRDDAVALLEVEQTAGTPLRSARALAMAAILAAADGRADIAQSHWRSVQTHARQALADPVTEAQASALLGIAVAQGAAGSELPPGAVHRQWLDHPVVLDSLFSAVQTMSGDVDDRAITAGPVDGAEHINMGARDVRQLIEAKDWLDAKYHQHLQQIAELEQYVAELEQARQWLDGQYHGLTAELKRLNDAVKPSADNPPG